MKVFEVILFSCFEDETHISTLIFAKEKDARRFFNERVISFHREAVLYIGCALTETSSPYFYEAYKEGNASDYKVSITLCEKEVQ